MMGLCSSGTQGVHLPPSKAVQAASFNVKLQHSKQTIFHVISFSFRSMPWLVEKSPALPHFPGDFWELSPYWFWGQGGGTLGLSTTWVRRYSRRFFLGLPFRISVKSKNQLFFPIKLWSRKDGHLFLGLSRNIFDMDLLQSLSLQTMKKKMKNELKHQEVLNLYHPKWKKK